MKYVKRCLKKSIFSYSSTELSDVMRSFGHPSFRAQQLCDWLYKKGVVDLDNMGNMPKELGKQLRAQFSFDLPSIDHVVQGDDGSYKFLLASSDGATSEAICMRDGKRVTLCVSCMVGCPLKCAFCATGTQVGFVRKLDQSEIVGQYLAVYAYIRKHQIASRITNIVFMGMGEPLLNSTAVARAIAVLSDSHCCDIAPAKIAVSTAGVCTGLVAFMRETGVRLAVSLHFPNDELRSEYMPINRRFPLQELIATLQQVPLKKRDHIVIEYMLLKGINDTREHAQQLVRLLSRLKVKINLIPYNPTEILNAQPSGEAAINTFARYLKNKGFIVTVRRSKGVSVEGGCGQFALKKSC